MSDKNEMGVMNETGETIEARTWNTFAKLAKSKCPSSGQEESRRQERDGRHERDGRNDRGPDLEHLRKTCKIQVPQFRPRRKQKKGAEKPFSTRAKRSFGFFQNVVLRHRHELHA